MFSHGEYEAFMETSRDPYTDILKVYDLIGDGERIRSLCRNIDTSGRPYNREEDIAELLSKSGMKDKAAEIYLGLFRREPRPVYLRGVTDNSDIDGDALISEALSKERGGSGSNFK